MIVAYKISYQKYVTSILTSECTGSGFFIAPDLLCTSYHVIEGANITDILVIWQGKKLQVDDYSIYEDFDLVFLKTTGANNRGWLPFNTLENIVEGNNYCAFGYPDEHEFDGSPLFLTYTGINQFNTILTFSSDNVTPGYSGSPIFSTNGKYLVGMMEISRDIKNPSGGRGLSAEKILELLCRDNKFYKYALLMLGENEFFSIDDSQWAKDNAFISTACEKSLHYFLHCNMSSDFRQIMSPYLIVNGFDILTDFYLSVAVLVSKKFNSFIDEYKTWLIKNKMYYYNEEIEKTLQFINNLIRPLPKAACNVSENFCNILSHIPIAGSRELRLNVLFYSISKLFVPFNLEFSGKKCYDTEVKEASNYLFDIFQKNYNVFILSNPGVGKSTFSIVLFRYILELRKSNNISYIPIYVDLQQEDKETVLDREWISRKISLIYGLNNLPVDYLKEDLSEVVLIMDGLDEYLSIQSKNKVKSFFKNPIFCIDNRLHMVLTCRKQFYDNYVQFNPVALQYYKIYLLPWNEIQKREYISHYVQIIAKDRNVDSEIFEIESSIFNDQYVCDLSSTPLYLNMSIEVLYENPNHHVDSLVDLYNQYTNIWIIKEYSHNAEIYGSYFVAEDISSLLPRISWEYFKKYGTKFTKKDVLNVITNNNIVLEENNKQVCEKKVEFIIFHTFFIPENNNFNVGNIKYVHKSFLEFYVSKYVFSIISNPQISPSELIDVHKLFLPHEISEMIKEFFLHNNLISSIQSKKIKKCILKNCEKALNILSKNNTHELGTIDNDEQRIACQQLIYHLGQVNLQSATQYLKLHLQVENDLWNKRTIVLGLSFSGDESELNAYVNRMREERQNSMDEFESRVNIGFSLSFFGDQPFDDEHPEIDQGLPKCKNTVIGLIQQLSVVRNRPTWRNDMYTLVDLSRHRKISEDEYNETIISNKQRLLEIIKKIEQFDEETKKWPEINEMRNIISQIEKNYE